MSIPALQAARRRLQQETVRLEALERQAALVGARLRAARERAAAQDAADLAAASIKADLAVAALRGKIDGERSALLQTTAGEYGYELLDRDLPILLLPVRLETRFVYVDAAGARSFAATANTVQARLLIRVYPDAIHEVGHEPELTAEELAWARVFADETKAAGNSAPALGAAWARLVAAVGPTRGAWIAAQVDAGLPTEPGRGGAWTRAPRADCLPDRWLAIVETGGVRRSGSSNMVRDPLFSGFDPSATTSRAGDDVPDLDEGVRWKIDFDEAWKAGMAIDLELGPIAERINRLVVLGVRATLDESAARDRLATLLDAHHYTRGLAFLPQATPTNSTDEARAGHSSAVPDAETTYPVERAASLAADGDGGNGALTARALGLPASVFAHVNHANGSEGRDAAAMQAALWPATWGFYLEEMLRPLVPPAGVAAVREHALAHLRARGPLPALRVGVQPYGILPVTPIDPRGAAPIEARLADLIGQLRPSWEAAVAGVPTVGAGGDPDGTMLDILRTDAVPRHLAGRPLLGSALAALLASNGDVFDNVWLAERNAEASTFLDALGARRGAFLAGCIFLPFAFEFTVPAVGTSNRNADPAEQPSGYIGWLRNLSLETHLRGRYPHGVGPSSVLFALLRDSLLRAADAIAKDLLVAAGAGTPDDWVEPELISGVTRRGVPTVSTAARRLRTRLGPTTIASQIDALTAYATPAERALGDLREALDVLAARPVAELEVLLFETLALSSYRLDAWITSLADRRLAELRAARPDGIQLGGYGWVEDLRPTGGLHLEADPPMHEADGPLFTDSRNAGYVHAPSLAHAAAAAVLRSGHLSHAAAGGGDALAIDLSSDRVRVAQHLLEGVRHGQPLGALLGYRIERGLHDRGLDVFIAPLRSHAPLTAGKLTQTTDPVEAIAANTVVDGLRLLREARRSSDLPWGTQPLLPAPTFPQAAGINAVLTDAATALDALADAITAEAAFQAARGNPTRLAATVDSLAGTDALPTELEVVRSARSGVAVTHRLLVVSTGTPRLPVGWDAIPATPRALAEPQLNAWAASILPAPDAIRVRAATDDWVADETLGHLLSMLDEKVQFGPLDLVALTIPSDGGQSELELRLAVAFNNLRPHSATGRLRLVLARDPAWQPSVIGLAEALEVARAARELIAGARSMEPRDLLRPGADTTPTVTANLDELGARADAAVTSFAQAADRLTLAGDDDARRYALFAVAQFGVQGAPPAASTNDEPVDAKMLRRQAISVAAELNTRRTALDEIEAELAGAADDAARLDIHRRRLEGVFGRGFTVLPLYEPVDTTELADAYAASTATQGGDPTQVRTWLQRAARIRNGARRAEAVLTYADVIATAALDGVAAPHPLAVAQLPHVDGARWVGLDMPAGERLTGGRLSIVLAMRGALDLTEPMVGLVVDEWTEVVPSRTETTAVSFHYDAPSSVAPQALLLALPHRSAEAWDAALLERIVVEALALTKLRAVDPDLLGDVGHLLPALVAPDNVANEAIGPAFERLAAQRP